MLHTGIGHNGTVSPRTIITGIRLEVKNHCKTEFGSYVQTHEAHDNSMAPRTICASTLCPTGNEQGGSTSTALILGIESTDTVVPTSKCLKMYKQGT